MAVRATITSINAASSVKASISYVKPEADAYVNNQSNNQWFYDNTLVSDLHITVITKPLVDTITVPDTRDVHATLVKTDAITAILDTFVRVVAYNRAFTDTFTMDDASLIDKDYYGNKGNVAFMLDIIGLEHEKLLTDSYTVGDVVGMLYNKYATELVTLNDSVNSGVTKILEDLAMLTDVPAVSVQQPKSDSASITDVSDVYSTLYKSDSVSIGDTYSRVLAKYLTDAFTLDDAALVDKDYTGTKGNVATMSDIMGLSAQPAISDSIGFSDVLEQVWTYHRFFTDQIVLTDVQTNPIGQQLLNTTRLNPGNSQFQLYRGNDQVDTFGISDVASIGPGKVFTDTLSQSPSAFSDYDIFNLVKGVNETLPLLDALSLVSSFLHTDTFTIADLAGIGIYKNFTDGFAVDDAALIDKNYYGNKGNLVSFSDILSVTSEFHRQFNDAPALTDIAGTHLNKILQGVDDQTNIHDIIDVRRITGGVLGTLPLNRVNLN
jgi:hypothetical protein